MCGDGAPFAIILRKSKVVVVVMAARIDTRTTLPTITIVRKESSALASFCDSAGASDTDSCSNKPFETKVLVIAVASCCEAFVKSLGTPGSFWVIKNVCTELTAVLNFFDLPPRARVETEWVRSLNERGDYKAQIQQHCPVTCGILKCLEPGSIGVDTDAPVTEVSGTDASDTESAPVESDAPVTDVP